MNISSVPDEDATKGLRMMDQVFFFSFLLGSVFVADAERIFFVMETLLKVSIQLCLLKTCRFLFWASQAAVYVKISCSIG
jgi:hypothetical protein